MSRSRPYRKLFRFPWRSASGIRTDVEEEIAFHLAERAEELEARGFEPDEARRRAELEFLDLERTKETLRDMDQRTARRNRLRHLLDDFLRDLVYARRTLSKTPGFTLTAIFILALGIGTNTVIFTFVNSMLLRPIASDGPREIVGLASRSLERPDDYRSFSYREYLAIREHDRVFDAVMAHTIAMVGVEEGTTTRRVMAGLVSSNHFATFGVDMVHGRAFTLEEERPGSGIASVVVSHGFWQRAGGDRDVLGSTVRINGRDFTVVGIAPEGFTGTTAIFSPDLWVPFGMYEAVYDLGNEERLAFDHPDNETLMLVATLRPELSLEAAATQLGPLEAKLAELFPDSNRDRALVPYRLPRLGISDRPMPEAPVAWAAVLLLAMAAAILLIACLNLANLLIARGAVRRTEIAIRLSLGGSRGRVVRQLLAEGLVLSLLGGVAGLLATVALTHTLSSTLAAVMPMGIVHLHTTPDGRTFAVTLGFCVLATLLFALGPAWSLTRAELTEELKEQRGGDLGGGRRRLSSPRNLLVVAQISLSLVLLVSGGLFVRGALAAGQADPGFPLDGGLLVELDTSLVGYDEVRSQELYDSLLERLRSLPGVEAASLASLVPFGNVTRTASVRRPAAGDEEPVSALSYAVGSDYFRTLRVPLLRGRELESADLSAEAPLVAVVDEPLARSLWGGEDEAVGRSVEIGVSGGETELAEVVGVVPGLLHDLLEPGPRPHVYVPYTRLPSPNLFAYVRLQPGSGASGGDRRTRAMLTLVREEIRDVDPQLPILELETLRGFRNSALSLWFVRAGAKLFTTFGGLALVLAVIGVYGVKSYVVSRRTREIGIRMALGASAHDVRRLLLREGLALTLAGLLLGLLLAAAVAGVLASVLYRVSAYDPIAFGGASLLLAAAALLATYLPSRRATRLPPTTALRHE